MKRSGLLPLLCLLLYNCGVPASNSPNTALQSKLLSSVTGAKMLVYLDTLPVQGFNHAPDGISAGADGSLYLCDQNSGQVRLVDHSGKIIASYSDLDTRAEKIFAPSDISVSGGIEVYVLDSRSSRILRLDRNLKNAYTVYSPEQTKRNLFGMYRGIAFDRASGDLYATNSDEATIIRIDMLGGNIQSTGAFGQGAMSLQEPAGIDIAPDNTLLVADSGGGFVAIQSHFGSPITYLGSGLLTEPVDVAALPDSMIAVADRNGVVIFDREGTPITIAGYKESPPLKPVSICFRDSILSVSDEVSGGIVRYQLK